MNKEKIEIMNNSELIKQILKLKRVKIREKELELLKGEKKVKLTSFNLNENNNKSNQQNIQIPLKELNDITNIIDSRKEKYRKELTGNTKEKIIPKKMPEEKESIYSDNSIYIEQKYREQLKKKTEELKKELNNIK